MAQSAIDICNRALLKVGAASITALTDNSPEARACNLAYDATRRAALRRHPWNFAITRTTLAPDATEPDHDYDYQFTLPSDCLRVLRPAESGLDWKIEGRKILTNDGDTLYLRYVKDVTDPTQFDSAFYDYLSVALAVEIVEKLTQSNTKKQALNEEHRAMVREARRTDAIEGGPDEAAESDWLTARY
jgi:hypothetical protein